MRSVMSPETHDPLRSGSGVLAPAKPLGNATTDGAMSVPVVEDRLVVNVGRINRGGVSCSELCAL